MATGAKKSKRVVWQIGMRETWFRTSGARIVVDTESLKYTASAFYKNLQSRSLNNASVGSFKETNSPSALSRPCLQGVESCHGLAGLRRIPVFKAQQVQYKKNQTRNPNCLENIHELQILKQPNAPSTLDS